MALIVLLFSRTAHAQFVDIGPKGGPNYTTQPGSGSGTGQIHCFAIPAGYTLNFCPNSFKVIYAGAPTSGLWKSIDGGQSWNVIDAVQHLPINSVNDIALSEECPNYTIYISTGNTNTGGAALYSCGIYKSTDFGQSFQPISTFNDVFHFNISDRKLTTKIAVSPFNTNLIFVATSDGLYRSTNGGVNWQLVCTESATGDDPGMPGIWSVECSRNDPNTIYCSGKDVYRSTDGGATFSVLTNYLISNTNLVYRNSNIKVANNGGVDKLVVNIASKYTSGTLNQLFTFNSGIWSLITGSTSGFYASSANIPTSDRIKLDVMRTNSNVIIAGATETHITTNSGNSWGVATPYGWYEVSHGDIHAIQFFPTGDSALIGTDGGIYKYFVNSNTYKEQNYGLSISYINDMSVSPNRKSTLVIGKNDTNTDWFDGSKWNQLGLFGDGYPPVLWDMYMDSIFYTDNPGCSAPCKGLYKVDTKLGTTTDISSQTGCYGYGGNMFQNPNPYRKDEMYKIEGKSVTLSNQINHATQFTKMDETHENDAWTASYRRLFVSKGDPNVIYVWNYVFEPPYNSTLAVKIHRENYTVGTSGLCSPAALCTGICDSTLHPLPLSDYSGTVVSTSYLPEVYNATSIANYFPVSAIVTSNTNPNKIWASFEMNLKRITDITTPMPSHKLFQLRKSTNRGIDNSWTDDDAGLPAMTPISHLLYIDGSDDALVCATHTGRVFFKKDGSTAWAELDPNLPHSPIAKIEFNYCQRKLYVGFIGRGVWVYDFSTGSPNLSALKINGSVNWSNKTLDIGADIDIMPGGILEISTSKVNMGKGTKITIEKGTSTLPSGRLLVDNNTVITNTCGELWKGIEVIGDPNQPQVLKSDLPLSSTPF